MIKVGILWSQNSNKVWTQVKWSEAKLFLASWKLFVVCRQITEYHNNRLEFWVKFSWRYSGRVGQGSHLKSTWIYMTVLKTPWKLNLPWKVLEKHSKALKSSWILPFTGVFNTVFGDLNQYKIVVSLFGAAYVFGAAYAAPNKGTTIL